MYLVNFLWAIAFVLYIGAEGSLIVLVVSEETKGRALGTYQLLMMIIGIVAQFVGVMIWDITGSLRFVYSVAGITMLASSALLLVLLKFVKIPKNSNEAKPLQ